MTALTEAPIGTKTVWNIDPAHSLVEFTVRHMMVSNVKGRFGSVAGKIETTDDNIADAKVEVEIDVTSINTGNEQRDGHLRTADFFDAESFPNIKFVSKRVEDHGNGTFDLIGDLTIRGVTKEITLKGEDNGRGNTPQGAHVAGFSASTQLNRQDFGVKTNMALETGGVLVGDIVKINLEVEAAKAE